MIYTQQINSLSEDEIALVAYLTTNAISFGDQEYSTQRLSWLRKDTLTDVLCATRAKLKPEFSQLVDDIICKLNS